MDPQKENELLQLRMIDVENKQLSYQQTWSRIGFFLISSVLWYAFTQWIQLRTEYKQLLDIYTAGYTQGFSTLGCGAQDYSPWQVIMGMAYPNSFITANFIRTPFTQDQSFFLWYSVKNFIPTQDQIDACTSCSGLELTPLSYLCGNILSAWETHSGQSATTLMAQVRSNPGNTPWFSILTSDAAILDPSNDRKLQILLTQGFVGAVRATDWFDTSEGFYNFIFGKKAPAADSAKTCSTGTQVAHYAGAITTGMMAGGAFGPAGAFFGAVGGTVISLFTSPGVGCKPVINI